MIPYQVIGKLQQVCRAEQDAECIVAKDRQYVIGIYIRAIPFM